MSFFQSSREFNYPFTSKASGKRRISWMTDSYCILMADSIRVAQPIRLQHLRWYTSRILLIGDCFDEAEDWINRNLKLINLFFKTCTGAYGGFSHLYFLKCFLKLINSSPLNCVEKPLRLFSPAIDHVLAVQCKSVFVASIANML